MHLYFAQTNCNSHGMIILQRHVVPLICVLSIHPFQLARWMPFGTSMYPRVSLVISVVSAVEKTHWSIITAYFMSCGEVILEDESQLSIKYAFQSKLQVIAGQCNICFQNARGANQIQCSLLTAVIKNLTLYATVIWEEHLKLCFRCNGLIYKTSLHPKYGTT